MQITSYSHPTYFPWNWETPDVRGIGGSETAAIEMAGRLAQRGHDVTVYAPMEPKRKRRDPRGAVWMHSDRVNVAREGIWIINRCPQILDQFRKKHEGQTLFFLAEDAWYHDMTEERGAKLDYYICLCHSHAEYVKGIYPYLANKIVIGSNGIKTELIREIETNPPKRNPRKMIFASSPDRGLIPLLQIFRRARQWIGGVDGKGALELHVFYGFQNMLKTWELLGGDPKHPTKRLYDACMRDMQQPGVFWHDRTPQPELYRQWLSAGIFCHPSTFTETNFITCQEAQAMGAIPITIPIWAAGEFIRYGTFIHGDPVNDPLTQERFVGEIHRLARDFELQDGIRKPMMAYARERFDWERTIDQLEVWFQNRPKHSVIFLDYDPDGRLTEMRAKSRALLEKHCNGAEIITVSRKGQASALEEGLKKATGRFLHVVCNDMMIEDPDWLDKLAIPRSVTSWGPTTFVLTGNIELEMSLFCIAREVYERVGGWDAAYSDGYGWEAEDFLARVRRAGFDTKINPVKATHLCSKTFRAYYKPEEFRRMYNRNMGIYKERWSSIAPSSGWRDYSLPEELY